MVPAPAGPGALVAPPEAALRCAQEAPPANSGETLLPFTLYQSSRIRPGEPVQVVVALHGMGGSGEGIAAPLKEIAEASGWALVAPDLAYGDWRDPAQVVRDDTTLIPALRHLLTELPSHLGVPVRDQHILVGFSRGGQIAQRYALFFPESTLAAVVLAPGTYTLPSQEPGGTTSALFPFGMDGLDNVSGARHFAPERLEHIRFMIGVGSSDNVAADVPREWDHMGRSRLERAQAFHRALLELGLDSQMHVFQGVPHDMVPAMYAAAGTFAQTTSASSRATAGCIAPSNPLAVFS